MNKLVQNKKVYSDYLELRDKVLNYSYEDMNLELERDNQVYIALFDIPEQSDIVGNQTYSLALIYGLNTHLYLGNGQAITLLEKDKSVMQSMQSLLISSHQILDKMEITSNTDFYNSDNTRVYLKTKKGIYFKEISNNCKEDKFILSLLNKVMNSINVALDKKYSK